MTMKTRTSLGALFAIVIAGTSLLVACSSDSGPFASDDANQGGGEDGGKDASDPAVDASEPEDSGNDAGNPDADAGDTDADAGDDASDAAGDADTDAETDAATDADAGDGGDAGMDASEPGDSGADSGNPDAEAGLPVVTCADQPSTSAYYFSRSANKAAITQGGAIYFGRYTLTRLWEGRSGTVQGTAEVFPDGDSIFLSTYQRNASEAAEYRTAWFEAKADGTLKLTELCASGKVGEVATGIFEMRTPTAAAPELWIELDGGPQWRYTLAEE